MQLNKRNVHNLSIQFFSLYIHCIPVYLSSMKIHSTRPMLFYLYTTQLSKVIWKYDLIKFHFYANHTQVYLYLTHTNAAASVASLHLSDVQQWMASNKLKLNPDKDEIILLGSAAKHDKSASCFLVNILGSLFSPTDKLRNLGVTSDFDFSFSIHADAVCRSCFAEIRDIRRIRSQFNSIYCTDIL